jgi:hypothetical protein
MYPPGYIEDFFVKADAVAAPLSPPAAEGTFEMGSSVRSGLRRQAREGDSYVDALRVVHFVYLLCCLLLSRRIVAHGLREEERGLSQLGKPSVRRGGSTMSAAREAGFLKVYEKLTFNPS